MGITDEIWEELNSATLGRLYLTGNALTTVKAARVRSVRVMQLGENNITTLERGTFQNHSSLTFLNVSRNSIGSLPEMLFPANNSLIALDISSNLLREVDECALRGLAKLLYLDLSNNLLEMLPSKVFSDLVSLQFLYLQGNKLTSIPVMSAMTNLIILNVSYNDLISLTDVDLQGLAKLQILHANNNRLQFVTPYFAANSPILASLWLQNNLISEVGTMGQHPSLYELRLDNNSLTDFNRGSPFIDMKNLNYLFLDSNQLQSIRPHWFPPTLQALSIGRNYFLQFYSTSFINLPQLKAVDLSNNLGSNALLIPSYAVNTFKDNNPKPTFDMSNNVFFCTCEMAYLKVIAEDGYRTIVFQRFYPQFINLKFSYCYTEYERAQLRPFNDVPLSDFTCKYTERFCDFGCNCCPDSECDCALTCPENCSCYVAGSGFAKTYFHIHCGNRNLTAVPDGIPPRATSVYLDGNLLDTVRYADLNHLRKTEILWLNGSSVSSIEDFAFNNMSSLIQLHLDNNMLTQISNETFGPLNKLTHLYLHNNRITSITYDAFSGLTSLETLTLHGNRLLFLDLKRGAALIAVTLSGNPWLCPCSNLSSGVISVIRNVFSDAVQDGSRLACCLPELVAPGYVHTNSSQHRNQSDDPDISFPNRKCFYLSSFESSVDCRSNITWLPSTDTSVASTPAHVIALIVTAVCLLAVLTLAVVGLIKRRELQAWTFVKLGVRVYDQKAKYDKLDAGTKQFDAFISYSSMDTEFVARTLVPGLEDKRYRLCVHYRDFPVGRNITDTIVRAIEESSRTILVLSSNFLHSEWCRFEFQTAHYHILREGTHRLIIVLLGDIPEEELDPDLKVQMKSKTYLKFNDPWFWEKLYFSLPNPREPNPGGDDPLRGMKILAGDAGDVIHANEEKHKQLEEIEEN
ncbi:toll-like receptor Tollo [Physella acuta]|uniref:toll-like receptor Tollo n=1 Tax=Physella acuta TaxID=109671 RepID=UPI0027DCE83F|nr:toll-like receptor Tollo [Physella acuta]